jgi:hypothetical protein
MIGPGVGGELLAGWWAEGACAAPSIQAFHQNPTSTTHPPTCPTPQIQALLAQLDNEIARQSSLLLAAQSDAFGSPPSSSPSDDIDGSDGGRGGPKHHHNNKVPTSFIQPLPSTEVDSSSSSLRSSNRAVARHFLLAQQARLAAQLEVRNAEAAAYVEHRYVCMCLLKRRVGEASLSGVD